MIRMECLRNGLIQQINNNDEIIKKIFNKYTIKEIEVP